MSTGDIQILAFSNQTRQDKKLLKKFVEFHWRHYSHDPRYIPLLNYEYLGFKLIGMTGFFEPTNLFLKHAEMIFFLAMRGGEVVGRCNAFVNQNYLKHWNEPVGFFGQFEVIDDQGVADQLIRAAENWLRSKGMRYIRGPQNMPVNEATPGLMTDGFESRPVMYYHYNKPYYGNLLHNAKFEAIKRVLSWEVPVMNPMEDKLERIAKKVSERYQVKIEPWDARPFKTRRREMFEVYNDAWNDNFGFVPFTEEEFFAIVNDMLLIMDKKLFLFLYLKDELAGFFGGVPNVAEIMKPFSWCRQCELLRAVKLLIGAKRTKGFRLGYLGVMRKYRRLGLDGVMLWQQKIYSQKRGYEYCDMGWVLEDNVMVVRLAEFMNATLSKTYTIFQKPIS